MLLAASVGVLFGVVAVVTKIVVHLLDSRGVLGLLATPAPYALQTSVPTMLVLEPVVAVFLGAVLLGEELDAGRYETIVLAIAIAVMTAATVALGRDEGAYEAEFDRRSLRAAP